MGFSHIEQVNIQSVIKSGIRIRSGSCFARQYALLVSTCLQNFMRETVKVTELWDAKIRKGAFPYKMYDVIAPGIRIRSGPNLLEDYFFAIPICLWNWKWLSLEFPKLWIFEICPMLRDRDFPIFRNFSWKKFLTDSAQNQISSFSCRDVHDKKIRSWLHQNSGR